MDENLDGELNEETDERGVSAVPVDRKIWWIHYILGCAVLLPWNGMWRKKSYAQTHIQYLYSSPDYCHALFSISITDVIS